MGHIGAPIVPHHLQLLYLLEDVSNRPQNTPTVKHPLYQHTHEKKSGFDAQKCTYGSLCSHHSVLTIGWQV